MLKRAQYLIRLGVLEISHKKHVFRYNSEANVEVFLKITTLITKKSFIKIL